VRDRRFLDQLPEEFTAMRKRIGGSIYRDSKGVLWMASQNGLLQMTGQHMIESAYAHGPRSDLDGKGAAVTLTEAQPSWMWVSILGDGVYRLADGNWTSLEALGGPKGIALCAFTDPEGPVWLGFLDKTLVRINGDEIRVFTPQVVQAGKVRSIHAHDLKAWIGGDDGVAWFDGHSFRKLIPTGASLHDVFGIRETVEGLWLNEHSGIVFIPHAEIQAFEKDATHAVSYRVFGFLDGVAAPLQRSTKNPALVQGSDGLLWFATTQGLVFVDPKRIPYNRVPPPVTITSVLANAKSYVPTADLALPDRVRNLRIDYMGISLAIPERVRYRYKLEGYETDWQEAGERRQAFYTNPGPGSYTFRVMAVNPDGVWNESGATIAFSIAAAFYETLWFRLLCFLAAAMILWMVYLLRLRLVTAQLQSRLGERLLERERIARELHDTLLQSFQGLMLRLQVVDDLLPPGRAKEQLELSLERADQAIAEGRRAVYNLRSATTPGNDLAEALREAADEMVGEGTATFRLVVEGRVRDLHPVLRDEVYRIAREALRNAFSHGRAQHIETEITYGVRAFRLRIRDDGEGIPPEILEAGRPGHYGLPGMRERAKQIGGKLDIWSGAGAGTEIELSIAGSIAFRTSKSRALFRLFDRKAG
jgi:signal transduction histidine kinase